MGVVGMPNVVAASAAQSRDARCERAAVFKKTKMCKFHILATCCKGDSCPFAHDPSELHSLPDLCRTKLCKKLITTGDCSDPSCRYAHNREELRTVEGFTGSGSLRQGQRPATARSVGPFLYSGAAEPLERHVASTPESDKKQCGQRPLDATTSQMVAMQQLAAQAAMVQCAQAHAAEAMRLQAMAACMQVGVFTSPVGCGEVSAQVQSLLADLGTTVPLDMGMNDGPLSATSAYLPAATSHLDSLPQAQCSPHQSEGEDDQGHPDVVVRNTFLSVDDDTPMAVAVSRLRPVQTAAGRLEALMGDATPVGAEMSLPIVPMGEPVKVEFSGLRSLSSSSLASMDTTATLGSESIISAQPAEKHSQDTTCSTEWKASLDSAGGSNALCGITVKNTFLDFAVYEPVKGLRNVQTAAGRLDLMCED